MWTYLSDGHFRNFPPTEKVFTKQVEKSAYLSVDILTL